MSICVALSSPVPFGISPAEVKKIIPFDRIVINTIDTEKGAVRNVYMAGEELHGRNVRDIYPLEGSGNAEMVHTKSTLLIQTEDFVWCGRSWLSAG